MMIRFWCKTHCNGPVRIPNGRLPCAVPVQIDTFQRYRSVLLTKLPQGIPKAQPEN